MEVLARGGRGGKGGRGGRGGEAVGGDQKPGDRSGVVGDLRPINAQDSSSLSSRISAMPTYSKTTAVVSQLTHWRI